MSSLINILAGIVLFCMGAYGLHAFDHVFFNVVLIVLGVVAVIGADPDA